jgi:uncharacterized protein YndB with AHSA1/START domain
MPASPTAALGRDGERFALRFERTVPHAPEEVWEALVDTERLSALAGAPAVRETGSLDPPDGWRELNVEYQRRFGTPAGLATPPPSR